MSQQSISILGSTGSIGCNTLNVIAMMPERYSVFALSAQNSIELLFEQCIQYQPEFAVTGSQDGANNLKNKLQKAGIKTSVLSGSEGLEHIAIHPEVDSVMAAIVGGAGLLPTLSAAESGKKVLLANKEALVMAGPLMMEAVKKSNARLLPIDSEHNAIFQCLPINEDAEFLNSEKDGIAKILLTASGGPFLNTPSSEFNDITPDQACAHPNWKMGRKISVDSASMANKVLELIEACYLFHLSEEFVEIVIHPQSVVHSMVQYRDGSVLAQLGNPDMRTPIAYGLGWPERTDSGVDPLDIVSIGQLDFKAPDEQKFPLLKLGRQAAKIGDSAPILFNAANEIAVESFLNFGISFTQIPDIIDAVLQQQDIKQVDSLETVLEEDKIARASAKALLGNLHS